MADHRNLRLETARLVLRDTRPDDAKALLAIHADPEFARFWSTPPWTELAQADALIARDQLDMESGEHIRLAIERVSDDALLGTCALFKIHPSSRRAELGYGLGVAHWGNGYAQEAVRALLNFGFGSLNLIRIEADIDPGNAASAKLLTRLGFQFEGRLRERWIVGGVVSDSAIYGLLQRDWFLAIDSSPALR